MRLCIVCKSAQSVQLWKGRYFCASCVALGVRKAHYLPKDDPEAKR